MAQNIQKKVKMTSEEMKNDLRNDVSDVRGRMENFKQKEVIEQNSLVNAKRSILKVLFGLMEDAGVDLNDLQSINEFLQNLERRDPDLAELFTSAFNSFNQDNLSQVGNMPSDSNMPNIPMPNMSAENQPVNNQAQPVDNFMDRNI